MPKSVIPKQPWLAVNLSMLMPGLGQFYGEQWTKGILISLIFGGLLGRGIWSIFAAEGMTTAGFWQLGIAAVLYGLNLWDAHHSLQKAGIRQPNPAHPPAKAPPKDAWYSLFLSQLLPGLGHFYLDQALLGGVFFVLGVGLAYWANRGFLMLMPVAYGIWAAAGYHAYRTAPRRVRSAPLLVALIVSGLFLTRLVIGYAPTLINRSVVQCIVPSESMLPTLQVRDRIFVRRNPFYRPQTGDIVVFSPPPKAIAELETTPNTLFVKRIVGLPGQQVQISDGQIFIDQQPLSEPYGVNPVSYTWGPEVVSPNAYFVLGDNRDASADSHVWGFLPKTDILGKAYKIYWPPERVRSLLK
ncbi:MAG: signal peptidase I [Cyanobacteria bacterium J06635_1]